MKVKENKIKEIGAKLDKLLEKAGQFNKYQFIILILFSFQFICSQFFNRGVTFLETKPYVFFNSSKESQLLKEFMCKNRTLIKVDERIKSPSIICDFGIYCDKFKIYSIKISLYSGMILGSFLSYNFADKLGRRKSLLIVIPFHILSLYLFEIMKPIVFGKSFAYALYFLYANIFLKGFFSYLLMIIMIIYVCDIINQKRIPLFITLLLACLPFSESITSYVFNYIDFDWRHILAIIASFNIIIYFILVFLLVGSPMFCLNNEDYDHFVKYLMKIGKINGKILKKEDFSFLKPYMSSRQKSSIFSSLIDDENENDVNDDNYDENNLFRNDIDFELKPGGNLVRQQKSILKEDFLEDYDENEGKPITSLIGKLKMRDYSPFDLFRKSQIKNFLILSFLWIVSMIIRNGISMIWKNVPEYQQYYYLSIFMFVGEFIGFFIVYKLFTKHISTFHSILVSLILLNFIFLLVLIRIIEYKFNTFYFFELLIVKVICGCMFLILIIISSLIYPLLIRTKGLGGNLAIATLGDIIALFVNNEVQKQDICLYFLMFEFFGLVFSYGLPNKIGTVILQEPYKEDKKELENEGGSSSGIIDDDEENEKINKGKLLGSEPISLDIIKKK